MSAPVTAAPAPDPPRPAYTARLPYKTVGDHTIHLEVWLPTDEQVRSAATNESGRGIPVMVWLHGGGWFDGAASDASLANLLPTLARGWAFVAIEYRLVPQVLLQDCIDDVRDGCNFVRSGELDEALGGQKVDGERLAVSGSSAGAALAIFASYSMSPPPRAVFSLYGVSDLSSPALHARIPFPSGPIRFDEVSTHLEPNGPVVSTSPAEVNFATLEARGRTRACFWALQEGKQVDTALGGLEQGAEDPRLEPFIASAIVQGKTDATHEIPPTVLVHGTADLMIPLEMSESLFDALKRKGVDTLLLREGGANHGFDLMSGVAGDADKMRVFDEANDFVARYI
ncbi:hypothetical protein JCM10212_005268 [Sporobolomyces blumeae]